MSLLATLLLLLLLSRFSRVRLCVTPETAAHEAPLRPWDSPGKNTGVGCHFLLQCIKVKSESEVAQLCPTLCDPMDCSLPGSSIHGIFQARVLEWGAIAFSVATLQLMLKVYAQAWTEKAMAPHSSTLAWRIPWMEEPGRLQSMGSLRVGDDWVTSLSLFTFMHWRRKWQPTPVFLPGESQGWWSLVGCRLWGCAESDTTEAT